MKHSFAFTVKAPGICKELCTPVWVAPSCEPEEVWGPEPKELWDIPERTELPNGEVVHFRKFKALWDTGAMSCSAISSRVVDQCRLNPIGPANVILPIGRIAPYESELYRITLGLPNHVLIPDIVAARKQDTPDYDVVIGMDVISCGDFSITNKDGKTVFSFRIPSLAATDFLTE